MSFKRNVAANFVGQISTAVIGIAVVPLYLGLLGAESYGLVAFFMLLQTWFQLLDLGLTGTVTREAARYRGGAYTTLEWRRFLRSMEGVFWAVGMLVAIILISLASYIGAHWLKVESLAERDVELALLFMAFTVAARWVGGLYRGTISGLERQVWLSVFNVIVVSSRFVGAIPLLIYTHSGIVGFFILQAAISVVETSMLVYFSYSLAPVESSTVVRWSWKPLRGVIGFSATIAFTTFVGLLVGQIDKLLVSRLLPLSEYGLFSATVMLASGIILLAAPVSLALLPRLSYLTEQNRDEHVVKLYGLGSQMVAALAGTAAIGMLVFSKQILWVWTGDVSFAEGYAEILGLYAVGNGFFVLSAFPYYLQYARGNLRLHLAGNGVFLIVLVPAIVMATSQFGALGAGRVWALTNCLFFLLWTAIVHRKFMPGHHKAWFFRDVLATLAAPALLFAFCSVFLSQITLDRLGWAVLIVVSMGFAFGLAVMSATQLRFEVFQFLRSRRIAAHG